MGLPWAPLLVCLVCGLITVSESSIDADTADCHRKICLAKEYDIREAVCCENHLHQGAGLSCCGHQAFHPAAATCCKVGHQHNLTHGLSQVVSSCCGLKAYDSLNEICCELTVVAKLAPKATCCGKKPIDDNKQMCCGPTGKILTKQSPHHKCCGQGQYNTKTECCCEINDTLEIRPINPCCSEYESEPIDDNKLMRCGPTGKILMKKSPHHKCCGQGQYDTKTECCCEINDTLEIRPINPCCSEYGSEPIDDNKLIRCGPTGKILMKKSSHHKCCGQGQYDTKTECCCEINDTLEIRPINPCCSEYESEPIDDNKLMRCGPTGKILTKKSPHHKCCGQGQYDTKTECCCEINDTLEIRPINPCCSEYESGVQQQKPGTPPICTEPQTSLCGSTCYDPKEFRCCDRNQSRSLPGQCDAVPTVYRPHTQVCCDGQVSEWNPRTDQSHGSLGQHCCGTEVYWPRTEICCDGHRHPKDKNMHCCGMKAYNIENQQMKCCAGTLYNLTQLGKFGHQVQCCGNILQTAQDVCCTSENKGLLYSAKMGFTCCGHLYYDTSLWSCCAGELSPEHRPEHHHNKMIKETRLQSVDNLDETDLCKQMLIGTLESVSPKSILFTSVLKIFGRNATVRSLPSPYILKAHDHCNFPKLSLGKTYLFDEVNVFTDFYYDDTLQLLHFIFSKCNHH